MPRSVRCSVPGCTGVRKKGELALYSFPSQPERRKLWTEKLQMQYHSVTSSSLVCASHFEDWCFGGKLRQKLNASAVPFAPAKPPPAKHKGKPSSDPTHPDRIPSISRFNQKSFLSTMDILKKSESGHTSSFPTSSSKIENKEEVIDSSIPYSYDNDNSVLTSAPNATTHFLTAYSGSEMPRSDNVHANMSHVKMEVFVDHAHNTFQDSNGSFSVSTRPFKNSLSSNYLSSPKVDHVQTEQEENCEVCISDNMIQCEPDITYCEQTAHSASESIYLENPSTCVNQHIGASEVQCTSAKLLPYSSNKLFSSSGNCEKPTKIEPIENPEDPIDNNIEGMCNTAQNNCAVDANNQNGVVDPGPEINGSTKMEVGAEVLCDMDQELCNSAQVSDLCASVQFDHKRNNESPLFKNAETTNSDSCQLNLHLSSCSEEESFCCEQCGQVFKNAWYLKRHAVSHSEDRPFSCELCGKTFKRRRDLFYHTLIHSDEKPFSCEQCGKTFKTHWKLQCHNVAHSEERPFSCEHCGKSFKRRTELYNHILIHSGKRAFSCEHCGKTYKRHNELCRHILTHSEKRPYSCEQCGKAFKTRERLKKHEKLHSEEKPFSCEQCGERFKSKVKLQSHLVSHSEERPFSCKQCKKTCKTRSELKVHERIHSEERPFSCHRCGKAFKTGGNLYTHLTNVHAEQRSFTCEHCGKSFVWRSRLNTHLATHA